MPESVSSAGDLVMQKMLQTAIEHHQAGRIAEAEAIYRQILQEAPAHPDALYLSGVIARQQGNIDVAIDLIGKAIAARPAESIYHNSLGNALQARGQLDEAIACYRQALSIKPEFAEALNNLGNAFQAQGKPDEAVASYRQALSFKPDYVEACSNLGAALKALGRLDEAVERYRQALSLKPDYPEASYNLGNTLKEQGRLTEAMDHYRQALSVKPGYAEAFNNLGSVLHTQGRLSEAVECYRQALSIKPDDAESFSNLIFTLDLTVEAGVPVLQAERRRWAGIFAEALFGVPSFPNLPDPERPLRIGYVSADLMNHSAIKVFGALLVNFDPEKFQVTVYSNGVKEDACTRLFQQGVTCWRKIAGLSDAAVADLVRQDGIDILVDLSGHSRGNRLLAFARKPAPIQITAWGYIGGTGMKAMDVFLADPVIVPPEEKKYYAEEVHYLPNVVSAFFPEAFPAVSSLPALATKGLTFGSFNRLAKTSAEAYQTWAQVLLAIPGSRMLMKTHELDDQGTREWVLGHFTRAGVDPQRIILLGKTSWQDHMAAFNRVDIALDPFPHGGGVTTLEGLMMGVPLITLRWPTLLGRLSASILATLGLADWIAETPEQYVALAVHKAQDLTALAELRQQLRPHFMSSIIGDTTAYVRVVEQEYRQLWREWCARTNA